MCPLCLAALTQMVVAAASAGGGVTALVAKTARASTDITRMALGVEPEGGNDEVTDDREQDRVAGSA